MPNPILPLLFGGDINVYSVARAFHEAYGIRSIAFGKYHAFPCAFSGIIDYRTCKNNDRKDVFLHNVRTICGENPDKTVFVIGCGDNYVQLAADLRSELPSNAVAPYISGTLMEQLTDKEQFYALCDQYDIPHPATFVYEGHMGHDFTLPFDAPFVAKPADGVAYWQHEFEGIRKVYICDSREELETALDAIYAGGYPGSMILQDFIPGDDSYMRVMTNYSDRDGDVTMMCLGHVLLEEHTRYGMGNHAAIITECNETLSMQLKNLLESLHYTGFSNFDIKYDQRDDKYKVFEINCRQGRSNYYVTGAGQNIATLLVEDYIDGDKKPLTITKNMSLWTTVPKWVAYRFISKKYHPQMKELVRRGAYSHSLVYSKDSALPRLIRVWKNHIGNSGRFNRNNKRPEN